MKCKHKVTTKTKVKLLLNPAVMLCVIRAYVAPDVLPENVVKRNGHSQQPLLLTMAERY